MQLMKQLRQRVKTLPLRPLPPTIASNKNVTSSLTQKPPSLQMFDSFRDSDKLKGGDYLLLLVFTALKCAHLTRSSAEALELAVGLYQETVDDAIQTKQERRITNYLLMQLGLLRCEQRAYYQEYYLET
uniref:Uncharacterized protein n=1 Tax=Glossina pallidipes TaxID=7398 RepID=A0A1A9ZY73_GLOPL